MAWHYCLPIVLWVFFVLYLVEPLRGRPKYRGVLGFVESAVEGVLYGSVLGLAIGALILTILALAC